MGDHQPGCPVSLLTPAACASPENAWSTRIALLWAVSNSPYVSYATSTSSSVTPQSKVSEGKVTICVSTANVVSVERALICMHSWAELPAPAELISVLQ